MQILIDSKEPQDIFEQVKLEFPKAKQKNLGANSGDLFAQLSNGIFICERKTPDDLVNSISNKSDSKHNVFAQCEHIAKLARFAFLIIDGCLYFRNGKLMSTRQGFGFAETGWREVSIEAALTQIELSGCIVIRNYQGQTNYAKCVKSLILQCERFDNPRANTRSKQPSIFDNPVMQAKLDFIVAIPGVGIDRAVNLIKQFPDKSINELLSWVCAPDETKIELWGVKTHQAVREFLNHKGASDVKP